MTRASPQTGGKKEDALTIMLQHAGQFEHGRVFGLGRHNTPRQLELGFGPATCLDALAPCQ